MIYTSVDPEVVGLKSLKKDHKKKEETGEVNVTLELHQPSVLGSSESPNSFSTE